MSRPAVLGLVSVFLFFAALPLTLVKPGLPRTLKADEGAYLMMAQSLAHDGDLRLAAEDSERVFAEFPYRPVRNLIVMTDDGWRSVYYGKPYLYSLFAAPFAALVGADGLIWLNMLLTLGMVWLGAVWLSRWNDGAVAALFAAGFFFLSAGFAYVFWLQPEVFNMAAVTACLFCGLDRGDPNAAGRRWWRPQSVWVAGLSGLALGLAAYNKPMLLALGAPVVLDLALRRRWGAVASWLGGLALSLALACGLAVALTGHPTPYLGVERQGVTLCEPGVVPIGPGPGGGAAPAEERPTGGAWSWIFRVPDVPLAELAENLGYFLWGRHTGLLLYFPFAALAVLVFLLRGRDLRGASVLAALAAIALFFLVFIPHNWQGGGGFVGNRYFVNAYPAFLFLVTRLGGRWPIAVGYALGGTFLGVVLLSPFGRNVPEPTLQSHVRNPPFSLFPLELSLRELPGYHKRTLGGYTFQGRRDVFLPLGDRMWVHGGVPVEIFVVGTEPIERAVFRVSTPAPENRIELSMGGDRRRIEPQPGSAVDVELAPDGPDRVRRRGEARFWVYRLEVETARGRVRPWTRRYPPEPCDYFPYNESWEEGFSVGAELTYVGTGEGLDADVFAIRWGRVKVPERVVAGEEFTVGTRLFNRSGEPWVERGAARVRLGYHWLRPDGEVHLWDGERTDLPLPVAGDGAVVVAQTVTAPARPGWYLLELDPVFERVAWFSTRNGGNTFRAEVRVVAPEEAGASMEDETGVETAVADDRPAGAADTP